MPAPAPTDARLRPDRVQRPARLAVAVLCLANGALFANLLPRYPAIKDDLQLSNAPTWWTLAGALLLVGAMDALTDVAQNSHGLRVQRLHGRSILNSFHAVWSVGAVLGGLMGAAAAGLGSRVAPTWRSRAWSSGP